MKNIVQKLQTKALSILMEMGFKYAVTNINVACMIWAYQPKPPKSLEQYKTLKDD